MNTRVLSSKDDLERALQELGEALSDDVKAYLIGGCAMILYNAKVATKDIDLVLLSAEGAESVIRALSKTGFKVVVRNPWNQTYAPRRSDYRGTPWSYKRFGRPGVVWMATDKGSRNVGADGWWMKE